MHRKVIGDGVAALRRHGIGEPNEDGTFPLEGFDHDGHPAGTEDGVVCRDLMGVENAAVLRVLNEGEEGGDGLPPRVTLEAVRAVGMMPPENGVIAMEGFDHDGHSIADTGSSPDENI